MVSRDSKAVDPISFLALLESGILTIDVNGLPLLKVDAESHSVDVETVGVKECNIKLSSFVELQRGGSGFTDLIKGSNSTAKELFEKGWRFMLYYKGRSILTMGSGVSKLTGHIRFNPLKLRKILEAL